MPYRVSKGSMLGKELPNYFTTGNEKFLLDVCRRQKVFEKIQGIRSWYLLNTACTNFASEKVTVTRFVQKIQMAKNGG